jgi:hypothetical protein
MGTQCAIFIDDLLRIHLAKQFQRKRLKKKSTNQKQELPVVAMFVNGSEINEQSL